MSARDLRTRLSRRAARSGIFLTPELSERLAEYFELLERWNRKINLTGLIDVDEAVDRLLLEPIVAARYLHDGEGSLLDIGSGGGSPALPMTLATPHLRLMMVEVKARKAAFLREAIRRLDLESRARVEAARYEELLTHPELHEAFTAVSTRAIRVESKVLTTLQAFLSPGGSLLLFRGPTGPDEPAVVVPPLQWVGTHRLVESLGSRLTVLTKRQFRR